MKRVIVFTSTRAEYGLLKVLINKLVCNSNFCVRLLVTGTHLSSKYGYTINEIYNDGYKSICDEVELPISNIVNNSELTGIAIQKYSSYLQSNIYNLAIILGDRFEAFAMAYACFFNNIDIAHIHGGEKTEGALDNTLRDNITLMSEFHFTSHRRHLLKVQSLKATKKNTFVSGPMILDSIKNIKLSSKREFKNVINYDFNDFNFLVSYHPVTKDIDKGIEIFKNLLDVFNYFLNEDKLPFNVLFTYPNCDDGNENIIENIYDFKTKNPKNTFIFKSLGQQKYLSALSNFDILIGNSSSGIIEAGFFNIDVLNIGNRQKGRTRFGKVFESNGTKSSIKKSINKILFKQIENDKKEFFHNMSVDEPSNIILNSII